MSDPYDIVKSGPITSIEEVDPYVIPDAGGPVTHPSQTDIDPFLAPALAAMGQGAATTAPMAVPANVARSTSGITDAGLGRAYNVVDKANAEARGEFNAVAPEYAAQEARAKEHFGDLSTSVTDMGAKEGDHWGQLLHLQKRISDFHETAAQAEAQIYEAAKQERAGYLAAYREQLAGVRALAATTGNPLGGLTTSQGLAMAAAQFAQGFLGAQGIHIDVSGQIDKWIDRSIQEHQMKINNLREAANDQLHLYDIARQTSEDDWEARQRYRGFVLAGFQAQIEMEGSRYQSSIAGERAKQKSAELQLELDKTLISIGDRRQARFEQIEKRKLDEVKVLGDLAHQKEMERIGWAQVANARNKNKPKEYKEITDTQRRSGWAGGAVPMTDAKGNVLKGPDGKPIAAPAVAKYDQPVNTWHFDPEDKDALSKGREAKAKWDSYQHRWDSVTKLRQEAYDELDSKGLLGAMLKGDPLGWAQRDSPKYREFYANFKEFIRQQLTEESGKVVTDKEVEDKLKQYPMEQVFANGENSQIFVDMRELKRRDFENAMEQYSIEGQEGEKRTAAPAAKKVYDISKLDTGPQTTPLQQEEAQARVASSKSNDNPSNRAFESWKSQAKDTNPNRSFAVGEEFAFAQHLDTMAQVALDPTAWAKRTGENPKDLQEQAYRRLEAIGRDGSTEDLRSYAQYLAGRLIDDPDALAKDLAHTIDLNQPMKFE